MYGLFNCATGHRQKPLHNTTGVLQALALFSCKQTAMLTGLNT
jgi:hypothetical protein